MTTAAKTKESRTGFTVKFNLKLKEDRELYESWMAHKESNSINNAHLFKRVLRAILNDEQAKA